MNATKADLATVTLAPALGVEIQGIDLSGRLSASEFAAIETAWADALVIVIRGQRLSDAQLVAFSRHFGELDRPGPNPYGTTWIPDFPEINVISNVVEGGRAIGNLGAGEAAWHADMTYVERPPKAGILHALELPPAGGATYFANLQAAWEALPPELRRAIDGKACVHDASLNSAGMLRKGYEKVTDVAKTVGARHPLVWRNPYTGRTGLFLGRRTNAYIVGLPVEESEALLDRLWAHATQPRFAMRHDWRLGDVLIWNNLAVLHRRDPFDPAARRVLHRTQVKGDCAIA